MTVEERVEVILWTTTASAVQAVEEQARYFGGTLEEERGRFFLKGEEQPMELVVACMQGYMRRVVR